MKAHVDRQFIREVEQAFNAAYPFLKIEFTNRAGGRADQPGYLGGSNEAFKVIAADLLRDEVQMKDDLKVSELEAALEKTFALPVQVFRKSGMLWIETRMTRNWTLKQQNDHGRDLL